MLFARGNFMGIFTGEDTFSVLLNLFTVDSVHADDLIILYD